MNVDTYPRRAAATNPFRRAAYKAGAIVGSSMLLFGCGGNGKDTDRPIDYKQPSADLLQSHSDIKKRLRDLNETLSQSTSIRSKLAILTLEGCNVNRQLIASKTPYNSFEPGAVMHNVLEHKYFEIALAGNEPTPRSLDGLPSLHESEKTLCPDASYEYSYGNSAAVTPNAANTTNGNPLTFSNPDSGNMPRDVPAVTNSNNLP